MSIQTIINSAQSIEVSRPSLVAATMSRSGRLFTGTRNWAKPWKFTVEPRPIWEIADIRSGLEDIMTQDKHTEQQIKLGQGGASWCISYLGASPNTNNQLNTVTVASVVGTTMTVTNLVGQVDGTYMFRRGDHIQPVGHRYPYVVTQDVLFTQGDTVKTVNLHRGYIPQTGYTVTGAALLVGPAVSWRIKVSTLPSYRYVPGQRLEFTGAFELVESII